MGAYRLTPTDKDVFWEKGFLTIRQLFSHDEVSALRQLAQSVWREDADRLTRHDAVGNQTLLSLRNTLRPDLFSATVRCERVAGTMAALLGDEVYHYHHKLMIKEPEVGGAWEWHQDYGYWYRNGCLRPDMGSCMIAITHSTRENGCLEVVEGSHLLGRLDHVDVGDQVCADPDRVEEVLKRLPVHTLELSPGDGTFFHANALHRSLRNSSKEARLSLINCYNTKKNDPFKEHHHPGYSPLEIMDDEEVMAAALQDLSDMGERG